jgi:hypothetical protein
VLKDAAERGRLTGTTFIRLNQGIGVWATLVAIGQFFTASTTVTSKSSLFSGGFEMLVFALPFWIQAYDAQQQKKDKVGG